MVDALRDRVRRSGRRWLLAPLRPSHKCDEPLLPFAEYVERLRHDGLPYDPWVRAHVKVGARKATVCSRSMTIAAPIAQWEAWTGIAHQPGQPYLVPSALIPIEVVGDTGIYREPNIWVVHDL